MRVGIYARVSTLRQAQQQTIDQQLERLHEHVRAHGWELKEEHVIRDDGYSGGTLNRPGLDQLRDRVKAGELDRILLTSPDRLSRSYVQQAILLEEWKQYGCEVEFLDRPMSQDPNDQLLLQIRGAVAEYERTLIGERMRRGRQMKYRAGLLLPWTHAPYGYRVDIENPRDPKGVRLEEAETIHVRSMFDWYLEDGHSLMGLTKHLQKLGVVSPSGQTRWNTASVRGILTNPVYTGQVYAGRTKPIEARFRQSATRSIGRGKLGHKDTPPDTWIPVATIPAIISQEQFDRVQAKLAQNRQFARRNNTSQEYLLRALVSCGVCRLSCFCRSDRHRRHERTLTHAYYVCLGRRQSIISHRDERCTARYIPAQQLDELVWQDLCDLLTHPEMIAQALERAHGGAWLPQELQSRREGLHKARVGLRNQVDRLTDAYLSGTIPLPEYQRRRGEMEKKIQALDSQDKQLDAQTNRQAEITSLAKSSENFCLRIQAGLANATFDQKRQLAELLIDRVVVTSDEVEIRYVIPTDPTSEHIRFCHLRKDYFDAPMATHHPK